MRKIVHSWGFGNSLFLGISSDKSTYFALLMRKRVILLFSFSFFFHIETKILDPDFPWNHQRRDRDG